MSKQTNWMEEVAEARKEIDGREESKILTGRQKQVKAFELASERRKGKKEDPNPHRADRTTEPKKDNPGNHPESREIEMPFD